MGIRVCSLLFGSAYKSTGMQALEIFKIVQGNFSDANVFSSTFENYTDALLEKLDDLHLPIFTQEIGDTWIYGESLLAVCSNLQQKSDA